MSNNPEQSREVPNTAGNARARDYPMLQWTVWGSVARPLPVQSVCVLELSLTSKDIIIEVKNAIPNKFQTLVNILNIFVFVIYVTHRHA